MSDNTQDQGNVQPVGDDGMNDDQRRLAKQKERDAQQHEIDKAGDAERARAEREQGEPEGSRGRNADDNPDHENEKSEALKAAGRKTAPSKAQGNTNTGK